MLAKLPSNGDRSVKHTQCAMIQHGNGPCVETAAAALLKNSGATLAKKKNDEANLADNRLVVFRALLQFSGRFLKTRNGVAS